MHDGRETMDSDTSSEAGGGAVPPNTLAAAHDGSLRPAQLQP